MVEIHSWNEDDISTYHLTYLIDPIEERIRFYPHPTDNQYLEQIEIIGFRDLPEEFSPSGFIKGGLLYYIDKKCREANVSDLIVERNGHRMCRAFRGGIVRMRLPYRDLRDLKNRMTAFNTEAKRMRSSFADEFFHDLFPTKFDVEESTTHVRRRRIIENLNPDLIPDFSQDEISALESFYAQLVEGRYVSIPHRLRLVKQTKVRFDSIAVDIIIEKFSQLLGRSETSESVWGNFLKENLYLIDSKYVRAIPEVILTTVRARQVDFGLMDYDSFLDIFEIKKPSTRLISNSTDRNNYYWHTDAIKAITQAEVYLHFATIRSEQIQNDLRRQAGFENVQVLKPKVTLIIGHSDQLETDAKKEDFRMLRESLKNVEIILYDELLRRLEQQRERIINQ